MRFLFPLIAALALLAGGTATAQTYPTRPVKLVVGYPPGGGSDLAARVVATQLSRRLGQTVVVENRPGAAGLIGATSVSKAEPDGYTILLADLTFLNPVFQKTGGLEAATDFTPISLIQSSGHLLAVRSTLPVQTLPELIAYGRNNPGKLNFGESSAAVGVMMVLFKRASGVDFTTVRYRGDAPLATALIGGEVDFGLAAIAALGPLHTGGKLRALATTRTRRSSSYPELPTLAEAGLPDVQFEFNLGLWAPPGTPLAIRRMLSEHLGEVLKQPDVVEVFLKSGADPSPTTPEEQSRRISTILKYWIDAARAANFKPE